MDVITTLDLCEKFPVSFNRLPKEVQNFSSWLSAEHSKEVGLFLSRVIQSMSSGKSAPGLINKCVVTILQTIGSLLAVQGKVEPSLKKKYSKTCLKRPLKNRQNKDVNYKWYLNEGQKYCRMLPLEHSAILLTCIKR